MRNHPASQPLHSIVSVNSCSSVYYKALRFLLGVRRNLPSLAQGSLTKLRAGACEEHASLGVFFSQCVARCVLPCGGLRSVSSRHIHPLPTSTSGPEGPSASVWATIPTHSPTNTTQAPKTATDIVETPNLQVILQHLLSLDIWTFGAVAAKLLSTYTAASPLQSGPKFLLYGCTSGISATWISGVRAGLSTGVCMCSGKWPSLADHTGMVFWILLKKAYMMAA